MKKKKRSLPEGYTQMSIFDFFQPVMPEVTVAEAEEEGLSDLAKQNLAISKLIGNANAALNKIRLQALDVPDCAIDILAERNDLLDGFVTKLKYWDRSNMRSKLRSETTKVICETDDERWKKHPEFFEKLTHYLDDSLPMLMRPKNWSLFDKYLETSKFVDDITEINERTLHLYCKDEDEYHSIRYLASKYGYFDSDNVRCYGKPFLSNDLAALIYLYRATGDLIASEKILDKVYLKRQNWRWLLSSKNIDEMAEQVKKYGSVVMVGDYDNSDNFLYKLMFEKEYEKIGLNYLTPETCQKIVREALKGGRTNVNE